MVPFRTTGRSNRSGRLNAENDVFEGLPIRQWRQVESVYGMSTAAESIPDKDCQFPEYPMPPDSHLLAAHTQALLRAARKPRFAKPSKGDVPMVEKREDEDAERDISTTNWMIRKWTQIAPHLKEPEREYLAKRRKGLPALASDVIPAIGSEVPTRTANVRRTNEDGTSIIYQVIMGPDQKFSDEVVDETIRITFLTPGTSIDGIGIANAQGALVANDLLQPRQRRRPPIPRKKMKGGPGRGKKKVMFTQTTTDGAISITAPAGLGNGPANTLSRTDDADASQGEATDFDRSHIDGEDGAGADDDDGDEDEDEEMEDGELDEDGEAEADGDDYRDGDGDGDEDMDGDLEAGEIYESDREPLEPPTDAHLDLDPDSARNPVMASERDAVSETLNSRTDRARDPAMAIERDAVSEALDPVTDSVLDPAMATELEGVSGALDLVADSAFDPFAPTEIKAVLGPSEPSLDLPTDSALGAVGPTDTKAISSGFVMTPPLPPKDVSGELPESAHLGLSTYPTPQIPGLGPPPDEHGTNLSGTETDRIPACIESATQSSSLKPPEILLHVPSSSPLGTQPVAETSKEDPQKDASPVTETDQDIINNDRPAS